MSGKSLLPAGVRLVERQFSRGDTVAICDPDGREIARGLVAYDAADAVRIAGLKTAEIEAVLGYQARSTGTTWSWGAERPKGFRTMASQWGRSGIPLLESDSGARHASRSLRCAIATSMVLGIAYFVAAPLLPHPRNPWPTASAPSPMRHCQAIRSAR
jgi:hypothetical protein